MGAGVRRIGAAAMVLWGGLAWGQAAGPATTEPRESVRATRPQGEPATSCFQEERCPFGAEQAKVPQEIQIAESSRGTLKNSDPAGCFMPGQSLDVTRSTDYDSGG